MKEKHTGLIREHFQWRSRFLKREMEVLMYGYAGEAMLVFPTSGGRCSEFEDRNMPEVLQGRLENGSLQLFCADTVNMLSWYNKRRRPAGRVKMQVQYERYILEELLPFVRAKNPGGPLGVIGTSMGGYHAMNLTLRHPETFTHCLTLGGAYDIRRFLNGYFDENVFEQNPVDYVPALQDSSLLDRYRTAVRLVMAVGENDFLVEENRRFSAILASKNIPHTLDVWGDGAGHDWPWWQRMAEKHLA